MALRVKSRQGSEPFAAGAGTRRYPTLGSPSTPGIRAAEAAELNSAPSAVHVAVTLHCCAQTAPMRILEDHVRRVLRRAIWYVRCIVGFSLVFSRLWGLYRTFGVWWLPLSLASFIAGAMIVPGVAERFPRRW
jgi:hypothetical protein